MQGFPSYAFYGSNNPAEESFKPTLASGKPLFYPIPKKKQAELGVSGAFPYLGCTTS